MLVPESFQTSATGRVHQNLTPAEPFPSHLRVSLTFSYCRLPHTSFSLSLVTIGKRHGTCQGTPEQTRPGLPRPGNRACKSHLICDTQQISVFTAYQRKVALSCHPSSSDVRCCRGEHSDGCGPWLPPAAHMTHRTPEQGL